MDVVNVFNASVKVGEKFLLHDISLSVSEGEILAIVGPNGAGKSTLLNIISGDTKLSSGEIALCEKPLDLWLMQERARHIAVLPQLSLLNFPYTVSEVVSLGRTPHSTGLVVDNDIIQQAMQLMDIDRLSGRLYTQLSGGEKQRTQLARVMAQIWREEDAANRLLVMDEPSAALDLGHQQQLMQAIVAFSKQGVAVLMVVHDVNIASRYADTMLALKDGQAVALGPVGTVLDKQLLRTLFEAEVCLVEHPDSKNPIVI